jgi:hypothetical protein
MIPDLIEAIEVALSALEAVERIQNTHSDEDNDAHIEECREALEIALTFAEYIVP